MKLKILQCGDPVLRQSARPLDSKEISSSHIQSLVERMRETMRDAPGVGLAAPQIGESLQLAVIEDREEYQLKLSSSDLREREREPIPFHVIINPAICGFCADEAEFFEGCLSLGGFTAVVPRKKSVEVQCLNEKGEPLLIKASGWYARILQHEIDHLHGHLYIDRMYSRSFMSSEAHARYWSQFPVKEVCNALACQHPSTQ